MKKIFLTLLCCFLLCGSAEAKVTVEDGEYTFTKENFTDRDYYTQGYTAPYYSYYASSNIRATPHSDSYTFTFASGAVCTNGSKEHAVKFEHDIPVPTDDEYYAYPESSRYSRGGYSNITGYNSLEGNLLWRFGETEIYKPSVRTAHYTFIDYTNPSSNYYIEYTSSTLTRCWRCGSSVSWNSPWSRTCRWFYAKPYTNALDVTLQTVTPFNAINSAVLINCTSDNMTLTSSIPIQIKSGNYCGSPAINSNNITIDKGILTDSGASHSAFIVGEESESSTTTGSGQTITTVKLSNPPVIIDWADFPG